MLRQVWIYMDETDEAAVLQRLSEQHGLRRLGGRFFKGSAQDVRDHPEQLETVQLKASERWIHLIHPAATKELVIHELKEGPFQGWSRLDEVRSEVITLVRPAKDAQGLAPGHLQANTHAWFGGAKLRHQHGDALAGPQGAVGIDGLVKQIDRGRQRVGRGGRRHGPGLAHDLFQPGAQVADLGRLGRVEVGQFTRIDRHANPHPVRVKHLEEQGAAGYRLSFAHGEVAQDA